MPKELIPGEPIVRLRPRRGYQAAPAARALGALYATTSSGPPCAVTEVKCLEFELEKGCNGLAMPYDRERVWQLEAQLREARQRCACARPSRWRPTPVEAKQVSQERARDPKSRRRSSKQNPIRLARVTLGLDPVMSAARRFNLFSLVVFRWQQ